MPSSPRPTGLPRAILFLFFLSGWTGLVFQVLWVREMGLLFGNTSQATATTLAAFFLGLGLGNEFFSRFRFWPPLRLYGLFEVGVALSALLIPFLLELYRPLQGILFERFSDHPGILLAFKFLMAVSALLPPTLCMGGTLPALSRLLAFFPTEKVGRGVAVLYAINTLGAAVGAYMAGFWLPSWLGYDGTLFLAAGVAGGVGAIAFCLKQGRTSQEPPISSRGTFPEDGGGSWRAGEKILAFSSGLLILGLEVLYVRMFSQVLQNSVYTFTVILVVFLIGLSMGTSLSAYWIRRGTDTRSTLVAILVAGALAVALSPTVFQRLTGGMNYLGGTSGWWRYQGLLFGTALLALLPPVTLAGSLFPYLLKSLAGETDRVARNVGRLMAINTTGVILGSVGAGFLLIPWLGLWGSLSGVAMAYLLLAFLTLGVFRFGGEKSVQVSLRAFLALLLGTLVVVGLTWTNLRLPKVRLAEAQGEELLQVWEGSTGTVAVASDGETLMTLFNNYYTLGAEVGSGYQAFMSHLPLLLHPSPSRVFYLGMGTGITAGGALAHPEVEEVVVTEIIPEAIEASRQFFGAYNGGLFKDARSTIVPTDGRNYLASTGRKFDVVIAELFTPWKAGTANLFTREHFQTLRGCLEEGGLFAQWIPLYQFSRDGFQMVARTMAEVFPQVVLWRGDFQGGQSIACLLAMNRPTSLDTGGIEKRLANLSLSRARVPRQLEVLLAHYCGNIGVAESLMASSPIATDSRPYLEFLAPRLERATIAGQEDWLIGGGWAQFQRDLLLESPPAEDVYWENIPEPLSQAPLMGWLYQTSKVLRTRGHSASPESLVQEYQRILLEVGATADSALATEEVLRFQSRLRDFEIQIESPTKATRD